MVTIFHVLAFGFVNNVLFDICHKKLEGECHRLDSPSGSPATAAIQF